MTKKTIRKEKGYFRRYMCGTDFANPLGRHDGKKCTKVLITVLFSFTVSLAMLWGCSDKNGAATNKQFEAISHELGVRENVAEVLQHFKKNAGQEDVRGDFTVVRSFCARRQLARPPNSGVTDPLLTKSAFKVLLGEPHAEGDSGEWMYYFNNDRTWYISLEFREQTLFYTGYSQLNP